ncbi:hypothetical protein FJZ27_00185 [Candidatus Peribacteria bacterium]|nr:hypothetical protein [Candidatus Peribacteria bacterium]
MTQQHSEQHGTFHITTNAYGKIPWLTRPGIPEVVIDHLRMTRNVQQAKVYAFCILPDHMHIIVRPGVKGLSAFMQSFKRNSSWHIQMLHRPSVAEIHESPLRRGGRCM